VLLRKGARLAQAAARRQGEHHLARGAVDAQRVAARLPVTAQPHEVNRAVEYDFDRLRLAVPAIEQRAPGHGYRSKRESARRNTAITGAGFHSGENSRYAAAPFARVAARLPGLREPLFDSTKSATRGAISARKREPLNTP